MLRTDSLTRPFLVSDNLNSPAFQQENYSFVNVWKNEDAKMRFELVVKEGILRYAPVAADLILKSIDSFTSQALSDDEIAVLLKDIIEIYNLRGDKEKSFNLDEKQRVERRAIQISAMFSTPPKSFLDIGCGNGNIAECLTDIWHLSKENSMATDVFERIGEETNFTYLRMKNGRIPVAEDSIDLDTMLMTLHHEANPKALLQEVLRTLKPGGQLFIREHDASSEADKVLFEALDALYFTIFNNLDEVPQPANYQNAHYWTSMTKGLGFEVTKLYYPETDSPIRPFHLILRKPEGK